MKKLILLLMITVLPFWMNSLAQDTGSDTKVEVYYFHAKMRCPTCIAVEEQTRKTLDENFSAEMNDGRIRLNVLNLEDKDNKALTEQFQVGWSSLILYVPGKGTTINLTEDAFANARSHPDEFRAALEKQIRELL